MNIISPGRASTAVDGSRQGAHGGRVQKAGVPFIGELLDITRESGVKLISCQMTMDAMGIDQDQLIEEVEVGGAASFLDFAFDADITLSF